MKFSFHFKYLDSKKMRVRQDCHTKIVETNLLTRFRLIEFQKEIGVWGKAPF